MKRIRSIVFGLSSALAAAPAFACSTCFGDPDSEMVKGAVMGVYVLVGVVSFVLAGIAGTSLFWIHRSRVAAAEESGEGASEASPAGAQECSEGRA